MRNRSVMTALLSLAVLAVPAQAGTTVNLLRDPGAEQGGYGSWYVENGGYVEPYGPRVAVSIADAIAGGAKFFAGGNQGAISTIRQLIDVSPAAADIDAERVTVQLSGFLGGLNDEDDYSEVSANFLRADSPAFIGSGVQIGPVRADERNHETRFVPRSADLAVPPGTRRILVTISSTRVDGDTTDGFADNISLRLTGSTFTPAFTPVTVAAGIGTVKVKGLKVSAVVSAPSPCAVGRTVFVSRYKKVIGNAKTKAGGKFTIKTKKHRRGKLTVGVLRRGVDGFDCMAASMKVPGQH